MRGLRHLVDIEIRTGKIRRGTKSFFFLYFFGLFLFSKNGKGTETGIVILLDHDGGSKLSTRRTNCRTTKCKLVNNTMKTRTCKVKQSVHVEQTEEITSSKSKLYS